MSFEELLYKILIPINTILIIIVWAYIIRLNKRNMKPNIYTKVAGISMAKADLYGAGVGLVWGAVYGGIGGGPGGALVGGTTTAVGMGLTGSGMAGVRYLIENPRR